MFKLVLEKAEEPEIKLPTSVGSSEKQESSSKTSISSLLTMPKPLTVWITINCGKFFKRCEYQPTWPASWEISMQTNKDSILKSRDITLTTKVCLVKLVFSVFVYGCDSWPIKKAKHWRIDTFLQLWCWRRHLRVPWTARKSSQSTQRSVLNIHWKDWCWSWNPILWPPNVKNWLFGKDFDAVKDWRLGKMVTTEDEMVGCQHRVNGHEF